MKQVLFNYFLFYLFASFTHQNTITTPSPSNNIIEKVNKVQIQPENEYEIPLESENSDHIDEYYNFNLEIKSSYTEEPVNVADQLDEYNYEKQDASIDSKDDEFNYFQDPKDLTVLENFIQGTLNNNEQQESIIEIRVSSLDEQELGSDLKEEAKEIDTIMNESSNDDSFEFDIKSQDYRNEDEIENVLARKYYRRDGWKGEKNSDIRSVLSQLQRIETLVMSNLQLLLALSLFLLVAHFLILLNGAYRKSKYFYVRSASIKECKKQVV